MPLSPWQYGSHCHHGLVQSTPLHLNWLGWPHRSSFPSKRLQGACPSHKCALLPQTSCPILVPMGTRGDHGRHKDPSRSHIRTRGAPQQPYGAQPLQLPPPSWALPALEIIPEALSPSSDTHRAARRTLVVPCPSLSPFSSLERARGCGGRAGHGQEGMEFYG